MNVGFGVREQHAIVVCTIGGILGEVGMEGVEERSYTLEVGQGQQVIFTDLAYNDNSQTSYGVYSELRQQRSVEFKIKFKMYAHIMRVNISPNMLQEAVRRANEEFYSRSSGRYAMGLDDCAGFARVCLLAIAARANHDRPQYLPYVMPGIQGQVERQSRRSRGSGWGLNVITKMWNLIAKSK